MRFSAYYCRWRCHVIINTRIRYHLLPQVNKISGCDLLLIKIQSGISLTVGVAYVSPNAHFQFDTLDDVVTVRLSVIGNVMLLPDVLVGISRFRASRDSTRFFSVNKERFIQAYIYLQVCHAVCVSVVCVCVYVFACVHACMRTGVRACGRAGVRAGGRAGVRACMCVCVYVYVCSEL